MLLETRDSLPSTSPLARYMEHIRVISPLDDLGQHVDRLPDGRTCIVFREFERGRGDVTVLGPLTRARFKRANNLARAVVFQFKPGWSTPLLGVHANELTDDYVFVENLWGRVGRALVKGLLCAKNVGEMHDALVSALGSRFESPWEPASAPIARHAARIFERENSPVESVAARVGVTARHLRRAFAENIGVTPKEFARGARLRRALALATTSPLNWLRIALDTGYYDQAHLVGDFRDLLGLTPTAFASGAREHTPGTRPGGVLGEEHVRARAGGLAYGGRRGSKGRLGPRGSARPT